MHLISGVKYIKDNPADPIATDIMEFGTYRGDSLLLLEKLCDAHEVEYRLALGFDSFEGLPEEQQGISTHPVFRQGLFSDVPSTSALRKGKYIKCWFNQLEQNLIKKLDIRPAKLIHIDCDLYISTMDALSFVFDNNLAKAGTVIVYDEFKSVEPLFAGGEAKAHREISQKYNIEFEEFFRNEYQDVVIFWQNCFVIKSFNKAKTTFLEKHTFLYE